MGYAEYAETRQSKQSLRILHLYFDNSFDQSKSMVRLVRAKRDGLVWSGLCEKDSQDDFDSECIGFDGSPDD